ncbi:hypothetical protein CR513_50222, partial [Mucuna pruriens]
MATGRSFSQGSVISFSGTPTITAEKLNWKNIELVVSLELIEILRSFKTYYSFWMNARDVFANDVQCLFDSTQKIVSLQQTNHDMVSHIAKARAAAKELKGDGIDAENSAMVASHGRGRSGRGTRGMSQNGKGGHGKLICSHCGKEEHVQNRCYDLIGWQDKIANISSSDIPSNGRTDSQLISDEEYQEFLRPKSNNHAQSYASPSCDKLSARAIKCVFLGYSRLKKGTNVTLHPQKTLY